jgi:TIR domain
MEGDFPRNIGLLWWLWDAEAFSPKHFSSEERFLLRRLAEDLRSEGISLVPLPFFPPWHSRLPPDESAWREWKDWLDYWRDHSFELWDFWAHRWEEYWAAWPHVLGVRSIQSPQLSRLLARLSHEGAIDFVLIVTPSRAEKEAYAESLREISESLDPMSVMHLALDPGGRQARQQFRSVLSLNYPSDRLQVMERLTFMSRIDRRRFESGAPTAAIPLQESTPSSAGRDSDRQPSDERERAEQQLREQEARRRVAEERQRQAEGREQRKEQARRWEEELRARRGAATEADASYDTGAMPVYAPQSAAPVTNEVHLGAAVPQVLSPSEQFVARFAAYTEGFRDEVRRVLEQEAPSSPPRLDLEVCRWQRGAKVTVRLAADQVDVANPVQTFTWNGTKQVLRFDAKVLPEARANVLILGFDIAVEGFPLVTLRPEVAMSLTHRERDATAGFSLTEGIAPTSAFASYASPDRREVLGRIRSLQIFTGIDVFLDNLSIRPGERWKAALDIEIRKRDVFWLFWSRNAKESEWVEWEWRTALALKSLAGIQPHPLEPAEIAPPPKELSALQFGAIYEWYISSLREPWLIRRARMFWHQLKSLLG